MPAASQTFHERFVSQAPVPAPGPERPIGSPPAVLDADSRADGHGRPGAADRVRERRQPAAGARRGAAEGSGDPPRARREPRRHRPPAAGRKPRASRPRARVLGLAVAWWTGALLLKMLPFDAAARRRCRRRPICASIAFALAAAAASRRSSSASRRRCSRRGRRSTSTLKDEAGSVVGGTGHARFRKGLVVAQVGLSVLLLAGAGALRAQPLQPEDAQSRLRQADQLLGFSLDPSLNGYSRERSIVLFQQIAGAARAAARRAIARRRR